MRRLALVLIALTPATSAFAFDPQPDPPGMPTLQTQTIRMGDGSVRVLKINPQPLPPKVLEPIQKHVESGESVVIPWLAVIREGEPPCGNRNIVLPRVAWVSVTTAI
jgi:hypothetical protein